MGDSPKNSSIKDKEKNKFHLYLSIGIISVLLGGVGAYFYSVNNLVKSWENKIYPSINVNGTDIGGKTKEEAITLLSEKIPEKVKEKKLILKANDKEITINYNKINPKLDLQDTVNKAFSYGKDESLLSKNKLIKKGVNNSMELKLTYDEKAMRQYKEEFNHKVNKEYKNATISVSNGNVSVVPEEKGIKVSEKSLDKVIEENINSNLNEMVVYKDVETEVAEPTITGKMLSKINGRIGTSTTNFNAGDWQRTTNLRIATKHINGIILMPGETFSYNDVVGERLASRGFMNGAGFMGNKVIPTIGGGVCQISTTLYQAVSSSGILPVERHPHSMLTTYSRPSEDAAVAWEVLDYKFKNTYDFPIYIEGYLSGSSVTFNIYGNKEALGGKTYRLVGVTKEAGGSVAARSSGYLVTYENGVETGRKLIANDVYRNKG
ncbi:VanW family protein [Clostridium sp.]|uniref:VanW family protein n=1 Tax=Clostridium sp. TaxID=1506 RepID=UPI0039950043